MITKLHSTFCLLLATASTLTYAQAPKISYPGPQTYYEGTTIPVLKPTNSGGVVTKPSYSGSSATLGLATSYSAGIAVDAAGNVYVADSRNYSIDKIPAGGGSPVYISNAVNAPAGIALDAAGNIYVSEENDEDIKEIPAGGGTPVVVVSGINQPNAMAFDKKGNFYISSNDATTVFEIYAGTTALVPIGSGFDLPDGIAVDASGNVYVSDWVNNAIKKIPVNGGAVVTLGSGFNGPIGIAVDPSGNVFVADYFNNAVKEIPVSGGPPVSLATGFNKPEGVGLDGAGNLYVLSGDSSNNISEIKLTGGYFVNPALPSGLSLNTTTGVINGTPSTVSASTNYTVTAYNTSGTSTTPLTISVLTAASNSFLDTLGISAGTLTPAFKASTTSYNVAVNNTVSSLTVTPTAASPTATITVNGTTVASGSASGAISLEVGANTITVVVTAQADVTTTTYTIIVNRAAASNDNLASLKLGSGTLSPAFAVATTSYTTSVNVSSLTVTPTTADPGATIKVNGIAVPSGSASGPINLSIGSNTINVVVTAANGVTTKTYTVIVTRFSNNDNLSALAASVGAITPSFSASKTNYNDAVNNVTSSITVTPTTSDPNATVTVNGIAVSSGTASGAISLNVGANPIPIVVTAQDGVTIKTYTLTVTRSPASNDNLSALRLSNGTLSPAFAVATTNYTATVAYIITSIAVIPTAVDANATIKVNGYPVNSGNSSFPFPLAVGPNTFNVVVTAANGVSTKTYSVVVTRISINDNLAALAASVGSITPSFSASITSYADAVNNVTTSVTVTPTTADSTATVAINGAAVTSGTASGAISLNVGANPISIVVTAQDGVFTKTYTLTVTRAAASNDNLTNLKLSPGTLSPAFAVATTSYTPSVANTIASITVTPTAADPNATIAVNGTAVTSGLASGAIPLAVGSNTINVLVTAANGVTNKTYSVVVTRAASGADQFDPISVTQPTDAPILADDGIVVHKGVSPNGDGIEDFLQIDNISQYPDNHLTIMNRNGQLIYETKGYDNSIRVFDGHSNKTGQMQLPGTYFFALDYTANGITKHKTGFLVLKY